MANADTDEERPDPDANDAGASVASPDEQESRTPTIDIDDIEEWEEAPIVTEPSFSQRASLKIAWVVLCIFGGVYVGVFAMAFYMLGLEDATFDGALELVKFLVSAILPIVTLAVGYYLGEKTGNQFSE